MKPQCPITKQSCPLVKRLVKIIKNLRESEAAAWKAAEKEQAEAIELECKLWKARETIKEVAARLKDPDPDIQDTIWLNDDITIVGALESLL